MTGRRSLGIIVKDSLWFAFSLHYFSSQTIASCLARRIILKGKQEKYIYRQWHTWPSVCSLRQKTLGFRFWRIKQHWKRRRHLTSIGACDRSDISEKGPRTQFGALTRDDTQLCTDTTGDARDGNELQQHDDSSSGQENIVYSSSRENDVGLCRTGRPSVKSPPPPARVIRDWLAIWKSFPPAPDPFLTRVTRRLEDYLLLR